MPDQKVIQARINSLMKRLENLSLNTYVEEAVSSVMSVFLSFQVSGLRLEGGVRVLHFTLSCLFPNSLRIWNAYLDCVKL